MHVCLHFDPMTDRDASAPVPYDLLAADHDLPTGRGPVERSYIICSTPRSGSTLLAEAMHRTEQLGVPAEYIDIGASLPYLYERWGCAGLDEYVSRLHDHRTTDNGVFGIKAHWHQLLQFTNVSQGAEPFAASNFAVISAVLQRVAPRPAYIFVTRRDKERQAVSHWLAAKTEKWINLSDDPVDGIPPYDFEGIERFSEGIDASEEDWERFFALAGVEPLRIVYEDFVAAYNDTVETAAEYVGIDPRGLTVSPPRMRRQSNEQSREYARRYREERTG